MKNVSATAGKVLIVSSDLELNQSLQEGLHRAAGFESILSNDASQVLEILATHNIDVVLTDHQLNSGTAFELAHEIRRERISKPEIILMSPDPEGMLFEAHQVGMAHILAKPINMNELTTVMKKIVTENRRFERLSVHPQAHGQLTGDIAWSANQIKLENLSVTNIGRGGFFFKVLSEDQLPAIGQMIEFELHLQMLPEHQFKGQGIVRWTKITQDETGAGIEFLTIPEESEKLISAFVDLFKIRQFVPSES